MRKYLPRRRQLALMGGTLLFFGVLVHCLMIPPVWKLDQGAVEVTRWRKSAGQVTEKVGPASADWSPSAQISRHVLHAFVTAEDSRFYDHFGIDPLEIANSLQQNIAHGRYVRGGSTITQQVVKVALLSRRKTLTRKYREVLGALVLEQLLTKQEILEWYINLVEFGDGVYGIREAARHYFEIKPELLNIQHAIHLAVVLPSPNGWSRGLRRKSLTDFGHRRFDQIARRMLIREMITDAQYQSIMATGDFGSPIRSQQFASP